MSCIDATSPIDIDMTKIAGKCDLKCSYNFRYNNSSCVATNRSDYISLTYDTSSVPPVKYNSGNYSVSEIRIYTPSLHSFSGQKTDAEFVIVHTPISGGNPLLVCVPIKQNNSNSSCSSILTTIINTMSSNAPVDGETTSVNIDNFNLNSIIPKKPFFSYTGTQPYQPCSGNNDFIVYSLNNACDISEDTLAKMSTFINTNPYDVKTGPSLFYNSTGPNTLNDDQIYIDCQPVGSSEDTDTLIYDNSSSPSWNFKSFTNSIFFSILIVLLLLGFVYMIITIILKMISRPVKGGSIQISPSSISNKL